ncbi:MAG: adenylate/guanylate cyclase domain-containing protein [Alphaproteobacteria bacterium]
MAQRNRRRGFWSLNLRNKLLLFAVFIAILPLLVAGQSLIRIARDELKSAANEQLVTTARQVRDEIDSIYDRAWLSPLLLIRNAIDGDQLGVQEKVALLTSGLAALGDVVALQITLKDAGLPLVVTSENFTQKLQKKIKDPLEILRVPGALVERFRQGEAAPADLVDYVAQTDDWLATVIMPMKAPLAGTQATLSARINLGPIRAFIAGHPFAKTGTITVVDGQGRQVFDPERKSLANYAMVRRALSLLPSKSRVIDVAPAQRPSGEAMLGAFAFPRPFDWAVLVEKSEDKAYLAVGVMIDNLIIWVAIGLGFAGIGATYFALRMSRPILAIGDAAIEVAKGNFQARVKSVTSRDEIGDLAQRINEMIVQLNERFQLQKFVSGDTMEAIRKSDKEGVKLGGDRKRVAILFADIRGYTAFAEQRTPEEVVDVLNHYFQRLADTVDQTGGDIDKFVGDQIMAVYQGADMVENVVEGALAIQQAMTELKAEIPDSALEIGIGLDVGDVVMGAMGSKARMDYTVLGDNVNLAARLCSHAAPRQTLVSQNIFKSLPKSGDVALASLAPIRVKGKRAPIKIYSVDRVDVS